MRLIVEGLGYKYPKAPQMAFQDVSFEVNPGQPVAIMGPSGTGKTTLLAAIGGLLTPQLGKVVYYNDGMCKDVAINSTWILQNVSLLTNRTVLDNVRLAALSHTSDLSEATQIAQTSIRKMGLEVPDWRLTKTVSGGESQRIGAARALASGRSIILADEPTGQLDSKSSSAVIESLVAASIDKILLIVTHDTDVADACARVLDLSTNSYLRR